MIITGYISECDSEHLTVIAPFDKPWLIEKQSITECEICLSDGRTISDRQRRFCYALFRDISNWSGHVGDDVKVMAKYDFIAHTGCDYFSLSARSPIACSMSTANEFLSYLIDFCIEHGIPTQDRLLDMSPDVSRYIYSCLVHKRCCITGQKAELHHVDTVGMGRNRKEIVHLGMRVLPLTRKLHTECHTMGQKEFNEKYHVFGIKLDKDLCRIWKVKGE